MDQGFGATVAVVAVEQVRPAPISTSDRLALFEALQRAADSTRVPVARLHPLDRDDGLLLIADGNVSAATLAGRFIAEWDSALGRGDTSVRCRIAMHQGLVTVTGNDWSSETAATAEQLGDAPQLHDALAAARDARVALITSDAFYRVVVQPGPRGLDPSTFAPVTTSRGPAWIQVVGYPWPPAVAQKSARRPPPDTTSDPPPVGAGQSGGIGIAGNAVVNGDMVGRDKIVQLYGDAPRYVGDVG